MSDAVQVRALGADDLSAMHALLSDDAATAPCTKLGTREDAMHFDIATPVPR